MEVSITGRNERLRTVSFTCDTNTAALLMACYDILTLQSPAETNLGVDYFEWLLEALADKAPLYLKYLDSTWPGHGRHLEEMRALARYQPTKGGKGGDSKRDT